MRISMEDGLFPKQQIPLSTSLKWTNEKAEANTYGYNAAAGVARTLLCTSASHLRHSQVQICAWGLLPKHCRRAGIVTRQWRFEIRVFLSLNGLLTATLLSPLLLPVYTEPVFCHVNSRSWTWWLSGIEFLTYVIWCLGIYIKWELILWTHQYQMTNQAIFH